MNWSAQSFKTAGLLGTLMIVFAFLGAGQAIAQGPFSWQLDPVVSTSLDSGTTSQVTVTMLADDDINEDDLKSLTLDFPDGLVPVATGFEYCQMVQNPDGTFECSNPSAQPIGSQILRLALEFLPIYADIETDLYLEEPDPGEAGAMVSIPKQQLPGFVLEPPESTVKLKANGWGVQNIVSDIPNQFTINGTPFDIHISKIELTFDGSVKNSSGTPFLEIPAVCHSVSFGATFTSYSGEVRSDTEPFPITNCQGVPYSPGLNLSLSSSLAGAATNLVTLIQANPGDAPTRELKIALPKGFSLASDTVKTCTLAEVAAKACPSHSAIGTVTIPSPISTDDLQGTAYLTEPTGDAIGIWVLVTASFGQIELNGTIRQTAGGSLEITFTDFPPLSTGSVSLSLSTSSGGSFTNPFACGTYNATSTFISHSEKQVSATHPLTISGCGPLSAFADRLEVKLWKPSSNRYTDIRLKAIQGTPSKLDRATFYLPKDLRIALRKPKRKKPLSYLELWGKTKLSRGRLYIYKRGKRTLKLKPKNRQLKGLRVTIKKPASTKRDSRMGSVRGKRSRRSAKHSRKAKNKTKTDRRTKVTIINIPYTREIEEVSLRLFGKRTRLLRTFKRCKKSRHLSFEAKLKSENGDRKEMSASSKVRCVKKKRKGKKKERKGKKKERKGRR